MSILDFGARAPRDLSVLTFAAVVASASCFVACSSGDTQGSGASSSSAGSTGGSASGGGGAGSTGGSGGGSGGTAPAVTWSSAPSMAAARYEFTATLLKDGRVFVAGGKGPTGDILDSTEIFDPKKNSWSSGPTLSAPRSNHGAALLSDGLVAIIGGGDSDSMGLPSGNDVLATVDLFDPASGHISAGPSLMTGRGFLQSAVLADGRVLVAGGTAMGGGSVLDAEMLDKAHTAFTSAGTLAAGHSLFAMTTLTTGDVFLAGGVSDSAIEASAERFDPMANQWTPLPSMSTGRAFIAIAPLAKGGVLAAGGIGGTGAFLSSSETLAGGAAAWVHGPDLPMGSDVVGGTGLGLLRLANGTVLGAGAYAGSPITMTYGPGSFSGVFDETSRQWVKISPLDTPRGIAAMVELADHRVFHLAGGIGDSNGATATCSITAGPVD